MYCPNCGADNNNVDKYCCECGAQLWNRTTSSVNQEPVLQSNAPGSLDRYPYPNRKKKIIIVTAIIAAVILFFVWALSPDLSVRDVKKGKLNGYQSKTVGDAFENYFDNCSWDAFTAEDDDSISVVEFIGYTDSYSDGRIKVLVQFTQNSVYDEDDEFRIYTAQLSSSSTGELTYLNDYELNDMLDAVYYGGTFEWQW